MGSGVKQFPVRNLSIPRSAISVSPKGLSADVYNATVRAVSALERASERKTDSEIVFAPPFIELQKSVDEVPIAGGQNSQALSDLRHCESELNVFRLKRQRIGLQLETLELQIKKPGASEEAKIKNEVNESFQSVDACIETVKRHEISSAFPGNWRRSQP
jgi:hypothetical protein